ncbi:MAG TPA: hypothetical protein VGS80_21205 [Ktedonobacterales bacterium]|nr:hypothetical protein [Ktedonobacterales bacterium]
MSRGEYQTQTPCPQCLTGALLLWLSSRQMYHCPACFTEWEPRELGERIREQEPDRVLWRSQVDHAMSDPGLSPKVRYAMLGQLLDMYVEQGGDPAPFGHYVRQLQDDMDHDAGIVDADPPQRRFIPPAEE